MVDWQAMAGFAQAAAIIFAALVARSTVSSFLRNRATQRKAEIAEESALIANSLAHHLRILRSAGVLRENLEFAAKNAAFEKCFAPFQSTTSTTEALLSRAERLRELGQAGLIYFGEEFELACRRVATGLENFAQTASGMVSLLNIVREKAKVSGTDISADVTAELAAQEARIQTLEGTGPVSQALVEESLDKIRKTAVSILTERK